MFRATAYTVCSPNALVSSKKVPDGLGCLQPLFHIQVAGGLIKHIAERAMNIEVRGAGVREGG